MQSLSLTDGPRNRIVKVSELTRVEDIIQNYPGSTGLLYNGRQLRSGILLKENVQNRSTLVVTHGILGGAPPRFTSKQRTRKLKPHIKKSRLPTMISLYEDDDTAETKCGHPITPDDMHHYCMAELQSGSLEFRCPQVDGNGKKNCNALWDVKEVSEIADWDVDEFQYVDKMLSQNYLARQRGIKECPFCRSYCRRIDMKNPRVICGYCKGSGKTPNEFCWSCLNEWRNGGNKHCGNADCTTEGDANATLKNCPTKTIGDARDVPSVRACPNCHALTEHISDCKHMNCWGCKYEFCFVCLSDYTGYIGHTCRLAARQVLA